METDNETFLALVKKVLEDLKYDVFHKEFYARLLFLYLLHRDRTSEIVQENLSFVKVLSNIAGTFIQRWRAIQ